MFHNVRDSKGRFCKIMKTVARKAKKATGGVTEVAKVVQVAPKVKVALIDVLRQAFADAIGVDVSQVTNKTGGGPKAIVIGNVRVAVKTTVTKAEVVSDIEVARVNTPFGKAVGIVGMKLGGVPVRFEY